MKKIIYSIFALASISLTNCSEGVENNNNEHENHGYHEHHEHGDHEHHEHGENDGHDHKSCNHHDHDHSQEEFEVEKPSFPVEGYDFYGMAEVKPNEAITVEEMVAKVEQNGVFEGNVLGVLDGVCKKMGCWISLINKSGESVRIKFKDHEFGVPTDTQEGIEVVVRGIAKMDTTTVEMQKHYLDDAKEAGEEVPQEKYDNITGDIIEISFISDAILVKK